MTQPDLFAAIEAAEAERQRIEQHRRQLQSCWPEWPGPEVGGLCSVNSTVVQQEDGESIYAYKATCRLLEQRPDGTWLAVIEGESRWRDEVRLILAETDIWAPVRQLQAARRAREGFAVRLVHFRERGYRYWAFQRHTGYDQEVGLSPDGYATEPEAWAAIERIATPTDRSESDD